MTSTDQYEPAEIDRRLNPGDVQSVRFSNGSMLHPGYHEVEVDRFLNRVAQELARLHAEKAELRDHVHALQAQLEDAEATPVVDPPCGLGWGRPGRGLWWPRPAPGRSGCGPPPSRRPTSTSPRPRTSPAR